MFQYNHCFGGTDNRPVIDTKYNPFQYNHCFGGTCENFKRIKGLKSFNTIIVSVELYLFQLLLYLDYMFQYNHCFGGTLCYNSKKKEAKKVSIQSLFRWNKIYIREFFVYYSFNTIIVSVELI